MRLSPPAFLLALATLAGSASALDRQGSAHGGAVSEDQGGFGVSGSLSLGVSPYNPSYAARPDNSGLALMRYAAHADVDLIGARLSIPLDVNFFSDRTRAGGLVLAPSEFDVIAGATSTWHVPGGSAEFGVRFERDMPVDAGTYTQSYVDARARYLFSLAAVRPGVAHALRGGDLSVAATLGWFIFNPSYAARPDNTGDALFRYGLHAELSAFEHVAVVVDTTFFTDRREGPVTPSELDLTLDLVGRAGDFELHVAYERDMPLDQPMGGPRLVQDFVYTLFGWHFDLHKHRPPPAAPAPPPTPPPTPTPTPTPPVTAPTAATP